MDFAEYYSSPDLWEPQPQVDRPPRLVFGLTPDGIPINDEYGAARLLRFDEHTQLHLRGRFHCAWLDLEDPADLGLYKEIFQRILDGWYVLINCEIPASGTGARRLLSWTERWYDIPPPILASILGPSLKGL